MTFEIIIGVAVVLAIFATYMFFTIRAGQRRVQQLMEADEAGDRPAVWKYILSGVVTLAGFAAMIGSREGVEGIITLFAVLAVFGGLFFFAWCAVRLRHWLKRDDSSSGPGDRYDNRFLLGGTLLASAAFVGGTATLVVFHGATTIIIYYVVVPLAVGLILFLQRSYRRLRRKTSPGSGLGRKVES